MSTSMFLTILAVLSIGTLVHCEDDVKKGVPLYAKQARADAVTVTCKTDNLFECNPTCDSTMVCPAKDAAPLGVLKCPAAAPYCESKDGVVGCQATAGTVCVPPQSSTTFVCTGRGYYPDVTDCTKYHLCGGVGSLQQSYKCPSGYIYSSTDYLCKRNIACFKATCPANGTSIGPYTPNPHYFYGCSDKAVAVFQCPNASDRWVANRNCVFVCPAEGRYVKDEKNYYLCYTEGKTLKYLVEHCPNGVDEKKIICKVLT